MRRGFIFLFIFIGLVTASIVLISILNEDPTGKVTNTTNVSIAIIEDTIKPTFIKNQTNTTLAGETAKFSLFVDDETVLSPNGQYIFSINQSGAYVNDSANFTTTGEWANVTKLLNSTVDVVVGYQWYIYDNARNSNHTITHHGEAFKLVTTEEAAPAPSPAVAGGGRRGVISVRDFTIDKEEILISLERGKTRRETITIKNTGSILISLNLTNLGLENFIKISEKSFDLDIGESKTIALDFSASEETIPDLYVGKLLVSSNGLEKEILISIAVETGALFDVELEIPNKFKYVLPGEEVSAKIILFNLGDGEIDTFIEYIIKDENGNKIISEKENRTVENQVKLTKTLIIPKEAKFGKYIFYVKVNYLEEVAIASEFFNVGERPFFKQRILLYTLMIIIALIILFIIIYKIKKKKKVKISSLKKENLKKLRSIEKRMSGHHLAKKKLIKK